MEENSFLQSYKKKLSEETPTESVQTELASIEPILQFEEKSEFVKPQPVRVTRPGAARPMPGRTAAIVLGLTLLLALVGVLIWFLSRGVTVIDLTDWTTSDALLWARSNGLNLQLEERYDDVFAEGRILAQQPTQGARLNKGEFVKITVSLGHDLSVLLDLPDLMTMTMSEIESWAAANFLTKVRITTEYHAEIIAGRVIRYEINDNTVVDQVRRSTPIYVIVSRGQEPISAEPITVPNFKEMSLAQAQQFAQDNGLVIKTVEQYDDVLPSGAIADQSVKTGNLVYAGDEIILTLSKGKKIIVPDFSALSKAKAAAVADDLGIMMISSEQYAGQPAGSFLSQSLSAGSIYLAGDRLELIYSLGNQVLLPSFVGQTRAAIEAWALDLNGQGASIVIRTTLTQSSSPKDVILYQDKANLFVGVNTTVRITVSLGRTVFMPDFVAPEGSGYDRAITRDQALALCEAAGIVPVFVAESKAGRLPGEIWQQSVAAGHEVYAGSTVTLKYQPANVTYSVPDFTGMTEAEILAGDLTRRFTLTLIHADTLMEGQIYRVSQQSVPAQTTVAAGSSIILTLSAAEP